MVDERLWSCGVRSLEFGVGVWRTPRTRRLWVARSKQEGCSRKWEDLRYTWLLGVGSQMRVLGVLCLAVKGTLYLAVGK